MPLNVAPYLQIWMVIFTSNIFNIFIEIKFIYYTVQTLKVYDSIFSNIIIKLYNDYHNLILGQFVSFKENPIPTGCQHLHHCPRQALIYFVVSMDLPILDMSYKCSHIICGLLWLASCT